MRDRYHKKFYPKELKGRTLSLGRIYQRSKTFFREAYGISGDTYDSNKDFLLLIIHCGYSEVRPIEKYFGEDSTEYKILKTWDNKANVNK